MIYGILTRYLIDPISIAVLILIGALIAEHYGKRALGRGLVAAAALFLAAFVLLPIDGMLARPLENSYTRPPPPSHVDGIVILSGGTRAFLYASRGVVSASNSLPRMIAGAELARRYPQARLIFSGSSGGGTHARQAERQTVFANFRSLGIAPERLIFEDASLDTWENLRNTMTLAHPRKGETWLLITSAMHMPRAMGIARRLGWKMVAWPSGYETTREWRPPPVKYASDSLAIANHAVHEWIGLAAYALEGKTQ